MAKYSSDSDSDRSSRHRRKHHRRSRSSSSSSSDSSAYRKKSTTKHGKSKRRHRSRSRSRDKERSSRSYKQSRGSSRDRDRRRYQSRRSKSYSPDRNKKKLRSVSREKSTSRSSSSQSNVKTVNLEKPQNSIMKDDFSIEPRIDESVLDEINSNRWVPKQFTSSAQNKPTKSSNIVIDISADTIRVPAVITIADTSDSIFHTSVTSDGEVRFERWVKKLYTLRQKAIGDMAHTSVT